MSQTVHIASATHFTQVLNSSRIVVADFYADWCGPCKAIAPVYEQLSTQLSRPGQITFVKVNTDEQREIAQSCDISAMPTFVIFKAGRESRRIRGADPKALDAAVKQLAQEASSMDSSGEGAANASGSGGPQWTGASAPRGYPDLTEQIDLQGLDFLNVDSESGPRKSIFGAGKPSALDTKGKAASGGKDYITSDTDEQLMLFIPFQSTVKLHSLHVTSIPSSATDDDDDDEPPMRPCTLKLYANRSHVLGFDEADDTQPTQTLEIAEGDWDAKTHTAKVELRFVKFQNITSLVVFVVDGEGDGEQTRIDRIRLYGETGEKRTMGKLQKVGDDP